MTFHATSGRIWIEDAGAIIFDTNEKGFNGTDYITGSIDIPARTATSTSTGGNSPVDIDTNHVLAAVNAAADVVIGSFSISASAPQGVANLGWFSVNGTYAHFVSAIGSFQTPNEYWSPRNVALYTFTASAGQLLLHERVRMNILPPASGTASLTLNAFTMAYKLYIGTFT